MNQSVCLWTKIESIQSFGIEPIEPLKLQNAAGVVLFVTIIEASASLVDVEQYRLNSSLLDTKIWEGLKGHLLRIG